MEDIAYEKLTLEIYQAILEEEDVKATIIQHNVKLKGRAIAGQKQTEHQIDVYWEYEIAGVVNKVAIECKNYSRPITKSIVTSFHSILTDIGATTGIIVAKNGFQSGAKDYALNHGIYLMELREARDNDWDGRVKTFTITVNMTSKRTKKVDIEINKQWVKDNIRLPYNEGFKYLATGRNDEIWIMDNESRKIKNLLQLEDELPISSEITESTCDLKYTYTFENGFFESSEFGWVKIDALTYTYDVSIQESQSTTDITRIAKLILKNALTGKLRFINTPLDFSNNP